MAIFRITKQSNYTVMSNTHLREKEMTLKAKGLLTLMLSLPDDWDYSINGLVSICKENETAIRNALQELEKFGYLKRERITLENGRFDYEYNIFEQPINEEPHTGFPHAVNPYAVNQVQLNTKKQSTKKQNKDKTESQESPFSFGKPKQSKPNLYQQYINLIEVEPIFDNLNIQKKLKSYLEFILEKYKNEGKVLYPNQFKGMLQKLKELIKNGNQPLLVIEQSIEKGYVGFYPVNTYASNSKGFHDNISDTQRKVDDSAKVRDKNGNYKEY